MKNNFLLLLVLSIGLTACVSSPIVQTPEIKPKEESIASPAVGETVTTKIGETMIKKGKLELKKALKISAQTQFNKKEGESSILTCALTVDPQEIYYRGQFKTDDTQADCYGSINTRTTLSDGRTNLNCPGSPVLAGGIFIDSAGVIFFAYLNQKALLKQDFDNLEFLESAASGSGNFLQEIVYSGRSGDKLKFIYKEFSESATKPDFFQEFGSSAVTGSSASFKNVNFTIKEANETAVTFTLNQNF